MGKPRFDPSTHVRDPRACVDRNALVERMAALCAADVDPSAIGDGGGVVTVFADGMAYRASYGVGGGDPVLERSTFRLPWDAWDSGVDARPLICTAALRGGVVETDTRRMPPMRDADAYMEVARLELDRRFAHGEVPEGSWPRDAAEAWRMFHDRADNMLADDGVFELDAWAVELVFALSEATETHWRRVFPPSSIKGGNYERT